MTVEEQANVVNTDADSFHGGTDFTEMYTDFNLILTINKKLIKSYLPVLQEIIILN